MGGQVFVENLHPSVVSRISLAIRKCNVCSSEAWGKAFSDFSRIATSSQFFSLKLDKIVFLFRIPSVRWSIFFDSFSKSNFYFSAGRREQLLPIAVFRWALLRICQKGEEENSTAILFSSIHAFAAAAARKSEGSHINLETAFFFFFLIAALDSLAKYFFFFKKLFLVPSLADFGTYCRPSVVGSHFLSAIGSHNFESRRKKTGLSAGRQMKKEKGEKRKSYFLICNCICIELWGLREGERFNNFGTPQLAVLSLSQNECCFRKLSQFFFGRKERNMNRSTPIAREKVSNQGPRFLPLPPSLPPPPVVIRYPYGAATKFTVYPQSVVNLFCLLFPHSRIPLYYSNYIQESAINNEFSLLLASRCFPREKQGRNIARTQVPVGFFTRKMKKRKGKFHEFLLFSFVSRRGKDFD